MSTKIQIRRDTAANWATANPVLSSGELALETDTGVIKAGDGSTHYTLLPVILTGNYVAQLGVVLDTDGVYYLATPGGLSVDTDGTTFYAQTNATARVVIDTDGVPYPVAI